MRFYDLSFQSPSRNLAFDDMLFKRAEQGLITDVLRLWESPAVFAVLGRVSSVRDDVVMDNCRRDGIAVLRRSSGGGTVLQGPGCLNFSFVLSKKTRPWLNDLHRSYREILFPVICLLKTLGIEAVFQPVSDLAFARDDKKFSGNAQRRGKNAVLHHGTLLYQFDLSAVERYLSFPKSVPDYRKGRPHRDFVANLNLSASVLKEAFRRAFPCDDVMTDLSTEESLFLDQAEGVCEIISG